MTTFRRSPSAQYRKTVDVIELLAISDLDGAGRAYAEAVSELTLEAFAKKTGWTKRKSPHVCTQRLLGKKRCYETGGDFCSSPQNIPGGDHFTEWVKDGRTVAITFEPYSLHSETLANLLAFCKEQGFDFVVTADSFYFPHGTLLVVLKKESD